MRQASTTFRSVPWMKSLSVDKKPIERQYWVDAAKSIGIYLIVFGHQPAIASNHTSTSEFIVSFLWTFHVPLFFFISGYLNKSAQPRAVLERVTFRLVIPYILIYLANVLLVVAFGDRFYVASVNSVGEMLLGVFWGTKSYEGFVNVVLWFLPALVLVELVFNLLIQKSKWLYIPFLAISIYFYQTGKYDLFLSIDLALLGLNYFLLGVYARKYNLIQFIRAVSLWILALAFIVLLVMTLFFASIGNVWYSGSFYLTSLLGGMVGIAMVVSLSVMIERLTKQQSFVVFISSNTLFIFCFHMFSNSFSVELMKAVGFQESVRSSPITALLSILILIPFVLLTRKFFPLMLGMRKKNISLIST
jgi:acyltransferase